MKGNKLLAIFAISALLASLPANNFVFADDDSIDDEHKEKMEKERELKKDQKEEIKEEIEKTKPEKKELREEYAKKLEEKKKILVEYREDLKEKFYDLKTEFKEKYAQLRISLISDADENTVDEIESEIKLHELKLLKHEFREKIKNIKLEAKQHFDELKTQSDVKQNDRKNKMHDRINELKEKYKNKIRQYDHVDVSDLDRYPAVYESKKIEICHIPSGNNENAQTLIISVNTLKDHLAHGDYFDNCESDNEINAEEETQIEVGIEDGIAKIVVKIGDEKQEFELEETKIETIIQFIADNTDLTIEEIETLIEFEDEEGQTITVELKEELGISQQ